MSQSVPFRQEDEDANRVGEQAHERRQRSDAALNRAKILDAARRALAENEDTSIRAIAEKAGLGRGTVHRHFPTREELMDAVRRQARDDADSDEEDYLRPPGELANVSSTPLSVADVLNKVPPFQLGEQIVAEAQRSAGNLLRRPLRRRPRRRQHAASRRRRDIPRSGHRPAGRRSRSSRARASPPSGPSSKSCCQARPSLRCSSAAARSGYCSPSERSATNCATSPPKPPSRSRSRPPTAITSTPSAAPAPTSPAAEIQQNLLPPRIARVGGATLAGNVLPGYEIGGDWFDYTENPRGTWIGIADSAGTGAAAAGIGAVTLGAFRSVRRESNDPAESLLAMHKVLLEIGNGAATSTATIGHWNAPASTFRWVTAGDEPPLRITARRPTRPARRRPSSPLGSPRLPRPTPHPTDPPRQNRTTPPPLRQLHPPHPRPRTPGHHTSSRQSRQQRRTRHPTRHRRPTTRRKPRSTRRRRHHHRPRPQRHDRTL